MRTVQIGARVNGTERYMPIDWPVMNYNHAISASIGFDTCEFDILGNQNELENLFNDGLGRDVLRTAPDGNFAIWNGFLFSMEMILPGSKQRISLDDMWNRLYLYYNEIDTSANPPTDNGMQFTAQANDTDSQTLYGIKTRIFAPAKQTKFTAADAAQYANTILQQYRMPRRSSESSGHNESPRVRCSCLGYNHTFKWRLYGQSVSSGTSNANVVIAAIVAATGDYVTATHLDTNTTAVQNYFADNNNSFDIIQAIASLGDSSYNRWLANVMDVNRTLRYKQASSSVVYQRRMSDARLTIRTLDGREVPYWEVRPDGWLRVEDLNVTANPPAALQDDLQCQYIESVRWSEPDGLTLYGSLGDRSQVMIARAANQGDKLL